MRVVLWDGAEYTPEKVYFHKVLFWTFVVFDNGSVMVESKYVKKITDDKKQEPRP